MTYTAGLVAILAVVWLLLSGYFDKPLLLGLGAASVAFVVFISLRMRIVDDELRILRPGLPIRPRLIRVRAGQRTDVGRVIYANSITLTPGTVTIDTEGDHITVHALTEEAAEGVRTGEMDRRVARVEGAG